MQRLSVVSPGPYNLLKQRSDPAGLARPPLHSASPFLSVLGSVIAKQITPWKEHNWQ